MDYKMCSPVIPLQSNSIINLFQDLYNRKFANIGYMAPQYANYYINLLHVGIIFIVNPTLSSYPVLKDFYMITE